MQCPKCQSSNVKSFSAWYASGTSAIDARTKGGAALYSVRTKGKLQTGPAQLATPPTKLQCLKPTLALLVAGTVGVPLLTAILPRLPGSGVQFPEHLFTPSIIAILACIPIMWTVIALHNWIIVPLRMRAWTSEWMCGSCQTVFDRADLRPTPASLVAGTVGVPILTAILPRLPGGRVQFPEHLFIPSIVGILSCIPFLWTAMAIHNLVVVPSKARAWS